MARRSWADYLDEAETHVRDCRGALERGTAIPSAPDHPAGPVPDDLAGRAQRLGAAYDQVALEVSTRMGDLDGLVGRRARPGRAGPRYVDRRA